MESNGNRPLTPIDDRELHAYEAILKNSLIGILYLVNDREILHINDRLASILGYTSKELAGKSVATIHLDEEHFIGFGEKHYFNLQVKDIVTEWPFRHKNGQTVWCRLTGKAIDPTNANKGVIWLMEDISNERDYKAQLAESEEKYKAFFEMSPEGSVILNKKGVVTHCNPAFFEIYNTEPDRIIGKHFTQLSLFSKKDLPKYIKIFASLILGKSDVQYNFDWLDHEGKQRKGEAHVGIIREKGAITGIHAIARDITAKHEIQEKLRESEKKYRELAELLPEVVFETNRKGQITYVNKATLTKFGYSEADVIGQKVNFRDIIHPEDLPVLMERLDLIMQGKNISGNEYRARTKDGKEIMLQIFNTPIINHSMITGLRGIAVDITARKVQEEILKAREQTLSGIYRAVPNGIGMIIDRTFIEVNDAFCKMSGYSREELIGRNARMIYPSNAEYDEVGREKYRKIRESGTGSIETQIQTKDGRILDIFMSSTPIDATDWGKGVVFTATDITYLKNTEKELIRAKEKAEESDRLKSAFLANVSHEIRTPMNGIIGFSGLLNEPDTSDKKRAEFSKIINDSCMQLLGIVDDILDISKIETGQMKLIDEPVNLNDLMQELHDFFSHQANMQGISFYMKTGLPIDKSQIRSDHKRLNQILNNLLNNAFKYTDHGYIRFGYDVKNNEVEFYVEDSGCGIDEKDLPYVFDRFYQVDDPSVVKQRGTGLGLSISKGLAEFLGGRIWVESKPGKGSVFRFTIPYFPTADKLQTRKENSGFLPEIAGAPANIKILIAEDDDTNYQYLYELLFRKSLTIYRACDGQECIDFINSGKHIDMIFMDIKMPRLDGYEATRIIRRSKPDLTIIALTAYAMEEDRVKALDAGCNDYISKPVLPSGLYRMLEKYFPELKS
ncbi:MAG: PAS domain S-box protein [Bacteroidetes bacterium]|nr:PAS domain S-box protein [Bacteroidota bacterium]